MQNVLVSSHASTTSAVTLVSDHAESTPSAMLSTTLQSARAMLGTQEIHSRSVNSYHHVIFAKNFVFRKCTYLITLISATPAPIVYEPCNPSPCGANANCRASNDNAVCECIPEHFGDPYKGCRPECVLNDECDRSKACLRNKCKDPCIGTCGQGAICDVVNHIPVCSCPQGYQGDPFTFCRPEEKIPEAKRNPCHPSPCGANSQCREISEQAVCSCLPGYQGSPPGCRPECVVSSECASNKACVNQKCTDPCVGACGLNARCEVINHSPICSCRQGQTGDPFRSCYDLPRNNLNLK